MQLHKFLLTILVISGTPNVAHAYRTAAELPNISSPTAVRWPGRTFTYVLYNQAPEGIVFGDYEQAVEQAMFTWTQPDCTSYSVQYFGPIATAAQPDDGINTIEWVQRGWAARGFDPTAPGQTDVLYEQDSSGQWVIKEADIYLNGENNGWTLLGDAQSMKWSVSATLIHESGHAAGLEHPCEITASSNVPACDSSATYLGVAMNPVYDSTLAALSADDQAGICAVYPKGLCGSMVCDVTETCTPAGCRLTCGNSTCDPGEVCESSQCVLPTDTSVSLGVPAGGPCAESADCERGLTCASGTCQGGLLKNGDPCTAGSNCEQGTCTQQGYCSNSCALSSDCNDATATCEQLDAGVGACISSLGVLGSPCKTADDCIAGECLADGAAAPVCTRLCDIATSPCPQGWNCASVDDKNVCVRPSIDEGCACRLSRTVHGTRGFWIFSLLTVIGLVLRRGWMGSRRVD